MDCIRKVVACILFFVVCAWHPYIHAADNSGWGFNVGAFALYDNNLFKRDRGREAEDVVVSTVVGFELDQAISRQHITLEGRVSDNRYAEFDQLNYQSKNLLAHWDWSVTSKLNGRFLADYDQSISDFSNYAYAQKNIKTREKLLLDLDWHLTKAFHFTLAGGLNNQKNSANIQEDRAYESTVLKPGVKLVGRSGSYLSFSLKEASGSYRGGGEASEQNDHKSTSYEESVGKIGFYWPLTAKSILRGNVAYLERFHEADERRDYRGEIGEINYKMPISAKFSLDASFSRQLVSFQSTPLSDNYLLSIREAYYNSSYYEGDKLSLNLNWRISSKMALSVNTKKEWRTFLGGLDRNREQRDDEIHATEINYVWQPFDNFEFSLSAIHQARVSNVANAEFVSDVGSVSLSFIF